MKITLKNNQGREVSIETGEDVMPILDAWQNLIRPALIGFGYTEENIAVLFPLGCGRIDLNKKHQTRDGQPVQNLYIAPDSNWPIRGWIGKDAASWTLQGRWQRVEKEHCLDLVEVEQ